MYKAALISADFEENTLEFKLEHEFTVKKGDYVVMTKEEFEELSDKANYAQETMLKDVLKKWQKDYDKEQEKYIKDLEKGVKPDSSTAIRSVFEIALCGLINTYREKGLTTTDLTYSLVYITKALTELK